MALSSAAPARSTGREAIDPRTACEPCWIRQARRTQAMFTYDGTLYCRTCLAIDGIAEDECALISIPVEKREVHQPESEAPMATPATAPTLKPGRGQRFCKCNCGEICGTKFGYVPGHGPVEAEPRKPKRAGRRGIEDREKIKQLACEMYRSGASTRAIAKELGIGNSLAHRLVSEDRTSRTVRSVKKRKQPAVRITWPEPTAAQAGAGISVDLTRVDVKVTPTWLDQWFSQLPIANKVAIFNAQSEL